MSDEPLFSDRLLALIGERCLSLAASYRRNHRSFDSGLELFFFLGAAAVLDCFADPAAKALADGWLHDLVSEEHKPCDLSDAAQRARWVYAHRRREYAELVRQLCASSIAENGATLAAMENRAAGGEPLPALSFEKFLLMEAEGEPASDEEITDLRGRYDDLIMELEIGSEDL